MKGSEAFGRALSALHAGDVSNAERLLKKLIGAEPRHVAGLNLLAALLAKLGRYEEAEIYIQRALNESASSDASFYNYGVILKALGRPAEALEQFNRALKINAAVAETWMNRGTIFRDLRRYDDAIADFDKAISLNANFAEALCNKGSVYVDLKQHNDALAAYDRALSLNPNLPEAWIGRGNVCVDLKQYDKALAAFDRALNLNPNLPEAWLGRGNVYVVFKRYDEAIAAYDRALGLKSDLAKAWVGRGNVCVDLNQRDIAFAAFDRALSLNPDLPEAWIGRGNLYTDLKQYDKALAAFERALSLNPNLPEAWLGRGNVYVVLKRYGQAIAAYDRALSLKPDLAEAWVGRGNMFADLKQHDDALSAFDRALTLKPDLAGAWLGRGATHTLLKQYDNAASDFDRGLTLKPDLKYAEGSRLHAKMHLCDWANFAAEAENFLSTVRNGNSVNVPFVLLPIASSPRDQLQCAKAFVADQGSFQALWRDEIYSHDRIRIAYLSADFREHPVGNLIASLLEEHDKSRFETIAVSFGPDDNSDMRRRIMSAVEHFVDVQNKDDQEIAELIRRREIEIVVDLGGLTDAARYNVPARRPAPIQVNYLGYPGTMGASYIDYIVADPTIIPEEQAIYFSERVVWLPESYQVNDRHRSISPDGPSRRECALPDEAFVYCCFNNHYKILPDVFDIWMRLMRADENAILWLAEGHPVTCANLKKEAEKRGVSAARLIFASRMPSLDVHLARLQHADLVLDTLPYNAHATASDALWAGVPLLTCLGSTYAGRVGASLLRAVGLDELITHSLQEYETLALKLAQDRTYVASLKRRLWHNRFTHPLFNTERFARHVEAAYLKMWERYQKRQAPEAFAVTPMS